jgi:hypothetical protein
MDMTTRSRRLFAFVLMPFDKKLDDHYRLGIKEVAGSLGFLAERVDEQKFIEPMLERIHEQIDAADIIIAEMTGQNPNVFYEVGYAQAKNKLCILTTATVSDIPFDLKHRRHIVHNASILTLKAALADELTWARGELEKRRRCPIRIKLTASANLTQEDDWGQVELTLRIDLHNDADAPSPEIEAIYLFTSNAWTFRQEEQPCPKADSAGKGPTSRKHFLKCPVRRLVKDGWAQVTVSGTRLFFNNQDEPRTDSRPIDGKVLVTLATSAQTFEEHFDLTQQVYVKKPQRFPSDGR